MLWCPVCRTEYEAGKATVCIDCDVPLVDVQPPEPLEPAVVFRAPTSVAEVVAATLRAEGIPAFTEPTTLDLEAVTSHAGGETPDLAVYVPGEYAQRAAAVLREPPMSFREMVAAEQAQGDAPGESDEAESGV